MRVGTFSGANMTGDSTDNRSMENMRKFRDNGFPVMVATKAFGMGIDKPNVRFTVNMNYSSSLESFVQEAGRAGRDRKMALSFILMADYNLKRIKKDCNIYDQMGLIATIKGHWFKNDDLDIILKGYGLSIPSNWIEVCNPLVDMVQLKCNTDNTRNANGEQVFDNNGNPKRQKWHCGEQCSKFATCQLRHLSHFKYEWIYWPDLQKYLVQNNIRIPAENIEYQGPDYRTVMFFFDNHFKGEFEEKKKMHELLSVKPIQYFFGNDRQYKDSELRDANGFMDALLASNVGEQMVIWISYDDESYQDLAKAIYRLCIIGLIDDFTQD